MRAHIFLGERQWHRIWVHCSDCFTGPVYGKSSLNLRKRWFHLLWGSESYLQPPDIKIKADGRCLHLLKRRLSDLVFIHHQYKCDKPFTCVFSQKLQECWNSARFFWVIIESFCQLGIIFRKRDLHHNLHILSSLRRVYLPVFNYILICMYT